MHLQNACAIITLQMDRSAIEINLVHAKNKKPGVAAPSFFIIIFYFPSPVKRRITSW